MSNVILIITLLYYTWQMQSLKKRLEMVEKKFDSISEEFLGDQECVEKI